MEAISVLDIFKIGIGPSSSHTMGPWIAMLRCLEEWQENDNISNIHTVKVHLYGSLAKTGKGHGTDKAIVLGLMGKNPKEIDVLEIDNILDTVFKTKSLKLSGTHNISFDIAENIIFHYDAQLHFHANGIIIEIFSIEKLTTFTYYSIGGGFILKENENLELNMKILPYPIESAADLSNYCRDNDFSISQVVQENERIWRSDKDTYDNLLNIWNVMKNCIYEGCHEEGLLPGGLNVKRRASYQNKKMIGKVHYSSVDEWIEMIKESDHSFKETLNWVNCFALAVNEQNASFKRVVTAPTNGAAGVIPAVMMYYLCFCDNTKEKDLIKFLFTAGELGSIFKKRATISAAMGGCQAEIGVSAAMAAGALTECLGGDYQRVLMAAEIAIEHHLGLTCDPVGGLVQIPCIERNAIGAMKAITASQIALASDPHFAKVTLDAAIKTMWNTAEDMNCKYKETSEGGLAVNIPVSLAEC